eukprot:scaffold1033_cov408-Prasinococcus_capsulatus_cf.AAC.19
MDLRLPRRIDTNTDWREGLARGLPFQSGRLPCARSRIKRAHVASRLSLRACLFPPVRLTTDRHCPALDITHLFELPKEGAVTTGRRQPPPGLAAEGTRALSLHIIMTIRATALY